MINFEYLLPTKVIFGKDTHKQVGEILSRYNIKKVLLHYGGGSIKKYGIYDDVTASLQSADIDYVELGGVQPNPRLNMVYKGIDICLKENVELILAVGGGSVIDSAKAIGLGAYNKDVDVWDYFYGETPTGMLPVASVLTIPAAGSETSNSVVISKEAENLKRALGNEVTRPLFAIMNPELTYTLPKFQTTCGAVDIIAHIMERYFSPTSSVDVSDGMSEAIMKVVIENVKIALENPTDYDARAQIMWAGTLAHNNILGVDKVQDWSSHRMEHEISAIYDIAHGAGLSIMFPHWMTYVYKDALPKFVRFAKNVWDVPADFGDDNAIVLEGISRLTDFYKSINMPTQMSDLNIENPDTALMAKKTQTPPDGLLGGIKKLNVDDRKAILDMAR